MVRNCPDCTSTLFKGKVLFGITDELEMISSSSDQQHHPLWTLSEPGSALYLPQTQQIQRAKNKRRKTKKLSPVLGLLLHNHPGIRSRSAQYLLTSPKFFMFISPTSLQPPRQEAHKCSTAAKSLFHIPPPQLCLFLPHRVRIMLKHKI